MWNTAGEVRLNLKAAYSCGPLHDDLVEPIYNSSEPTQYTAFKTYWEQWIRVRGDERGSGRSVVAA